jgi:hypothetical protein
VFLPANQRIGASTRHIREEYVRILVLHSYPSSLPYQPDLTGLSSLWTRGSALSLESRMLRAHKRRVPGS